MKKKKNLTPVASVASLAIAAALWGPPAIAGLTCPTGASAGVGHHGWSGRGDTRLANPKPGKDDDDSEDAGSGSGDGTPMPEPQPATLAPVMFAAA
jgi:hypothetical protein